MRGRSQGDPALLGCYFLPLPFCESALPATFFAAADERGLRRMPLATLATFEEVCLLFRAMILIPIVGVVRGWLATSYEYARGQPEGITRRV